MEAFSLDLCETDSNNKAPAIIGKDDVSSSNSIMTNNVAPNNKITLLAMASISMKLFSPFSFNIIVQIISSIEAVNASIHSPSFIPTPILRNKPSNSYLAHPVLLIMRNSIIQVLFQFIR